MRISGLYAMPLAMLAAPLAAQGFEGTISMKVAGETPQTVNWNFKGPLASATISSAATTGTPPSVSLIIDNNAKTATSLLPFSAVAGGTSTMNGVALVSPLGTTATSTAKPGFRKLGTSQTIAGLKCDDYELNDAAKTRACLTSELGTFVYPSSGMAAGGMGGGMAMPMGAQGFSIPAGAMAASGADGVRRSVMVLPNGGQIMTATSDVGGGGGGGGGVVMSRGTGGGVGGDTTNVIQMATVDQNGTKNVTRIATAADGSVTVNKNGEVTTYPNQAAAGMGMPMASNMVIPAGPTGPRAPTWASALRGGAFPLKVWAANGSTLMEITDIQHTPVSDGSFAVPDGYQQLGGGNGATMIRSGGGN